MISPVSMRAERMPGTVLDKSWQRSVIINRTVQLSKSEEIGVPPALAAGFSMIAKMIESGDHNISSIAHDVNTDGIFCCYSFMAMNYRCTSDGQN